MKKLTLLLILSFASLSAFPQEKDTTVTPQKSRHGMFTGRARTFFMATTNEKQLTDYYALGIGFGLDYKSPEVKNFSAFMGSFFIYNLSSSDLSVPDPATNMLNRYEIGLFDITDPSNRKDMNRLEQLYLQYRFNKSHVRAGRMLLKTPFINPQDGRLSPTFEQGFWLDMNEIENLSLQLGWITDISPRSSARWYSVGNSIGIYPVGVSPEGTRSGYAGSVQSAGVALAGLEYKKQRWSLAVWETYIENVSQTLFLQAEGNIPSGAYKYYGGIQFIRQDAVGNGGNADPAKQYATPGTHTNIWSTRAGVKTTHLDINLNATHISDDGRYLMPREWGRDPFYTFLPRERNEGYGNLTAVSLNIAYNIPGTNLKTTAGVGEYNLPDVRNTALNKYGIPSYTQFNADLKYNMAKFIKGADVQFLYVYKRGKGQDYDNLRNVMNKVNMSNFNLVLNYRFEK
jgi:hypothetical protein